MALGENQLNLQKLSPKTWPDTGRYVIFSTMQGWVCFEDEQVAKWQQARFPELKKQFELTTLDSWLRKLEIEPAASPEAVQAFICKYLPPSLHAEAPAWAVAIEEMRVCGLETADHSDYVFSHLPVEPKNQLLGFLFKRYLEELPWDQHARLRAIAEQARNAFLDTPSENIYFVRGARSFTAFCELAEVFKWMPGTVNSVCVEPFENFSRPAASDFQRRGVAIESGPLARLDQLALRLAARTSKESEVFISAEPRYRDYLKLKLASLKVSGVGIFPWLGKVHSEKHAYFFEHPLANPSPAAILSASEISAIHRMGFGKPLVQGEIKTPHRPWFFVTPKIPVPKARKVFVKGSPPPDSVNPATLPWEKMEWKETESPSLSATSAKNYLACPSRYFFQHVLNFHPKKDPREDLQLYFGVLVHKTLELYFRPKLDPAMQQPTMEESFAAAYEHTIGKDASAWLRPEILQNLWQRIAPAVPKLESELDERFGPRRIFGIEYDFRIPWEGILLKGRIDRADRLPDGSLLLIDYKTGSVDFSPGHVAEGKDFQPLFYFNAITAASETPAGFVYYDLKAGLVCRGMVGEKHLEKAAQKGFTRGHVMNPEKWDTLLASGGEKLKAIATGVREARFTPTPSATVCGFCEYFGHCRSSKILEKAQQGVVA